VQYAVPQYKILYVSETFFDPLPTIMDDNKILRNLSDVEQRNRRLYGHGRVAHMLLDGRRAMIDVDCFRRIVRAAAAAAAATPAHINYSRDINSTTTTTTRTTTL